jgi:iron complex outermembrane recepter protein
MTTTNDTGRRANVLLWTCLVALWMSWVTLAAHAQEPTTTNDADKDKLEEVVVVGVRASLVQGLVEKRNSTQVIESVVAEDIGKLPDNNVVEAMQRLSGVQISNRSGGEAQAVSIRGFGDIETTWNGRNIFTASTRQFALQDIPSNLVRKIDVYKTRSADQIETGIAGQVDIATLRPFDFKGLEISATARALYLDVAKKFNPNLSALLSDRWDTGFGEMGALVNLSYSRTRYSDQAVTAGALVPFATADNPPPGYTPLQRIFTDGSIPWQAGLDAGLPQAPGSTLNFGGTPYPYYLSRDAVFQNDLFGDRKRPAVNAAFQWKPNESSEYTAEFFYDGFRNTTYNDLFFSFVDWWGDLGPNPASTVTNYPGTNIIHTRTVGAVSGFNSGDLTRSSTNSYVYALSSKWTLTEHLHLQGDLSHQTSTFDSVFEATRTERVANQVNVNFNPGNGITSFGFDNPALLTDPAAWNLAQFYDNANRNTGSATTGTLDGQYDLAWGVLQKIEFGVRYDDRNAEEAQSTQSGPDLAIPLNTLAPGLQYYNNGFFEGVSDVPHSWVAANGYYVDSHIDAIRAMYGLQKLPLTVNFDVTEKTGAAYLQGDLESKVLGNRLRVQGGGRFVRVTTDMTFGTQSASESVSKFLPSVTIRYDLATDWLLRFNYGETLRRPNFADLNPTQTLTPDVTGVGLGGGTSGAPNLKPTHSKNVDLTAEWYFAADSALYATLFRRNIDGLVVPLTRVVNVPDAAPNLNATTFLITSPTNASNGVMSGAEFGLVYFPDYLPGLLKGFGIQASATSLSSHQDIPMTNATGAITAEQRSPFFGVSKFSYNATLAYERGPIEGRLSFVQRSKFVDHNEARVFANPIQVWSRPLKDLDMQLTYNFTRKLAVSFDAVNLTNSLAQTYYAFGSAGGPDTDNSGTSLIGRSYELGVRWKL